MDITQPIKPPEQKRRRRRGGFLLRFFGFMFAAGMIVFIAVASVAAFLLWKTSKDLPDYEVLAKYEPPVMTRIHANETGMMVQFTARCDAIGFSIRPATNRKFAFIGVISGRFSA